MKKKNINQPFRYEKKWIYNKKDYEKLLLRLFRSNLKFKIHHKKRIVNSIYFDNKNLTSIKDNIEGEKKRKKYRIRWYGSEHLIAKPVLEIKYKEALKSYKQKKIIKVKKNLDTRINGNYHYFNNSISQSTLQKNFLKPKIHVTYQRTYLISSNNLIRATIDRNIKYKKINKFKKNFFQNFNNIILEVKYDVSLDNYFRSKLNQVNARYSKSSKYINCMLLPSRNFST